MKQEQENYDNQNIVPLGSDEIRSILKSQSVSVFQDKNISNHSNFVKKSLIDIALDFEIKQNAKENEIIDDKPDNNKNLKDENDVASEENIAEEVTVDDNKKSDTNIDIQAEKEQSKNEENINSTSEINLDKIEEDIQSKKLLQDESFTDVESDNQKQNDETLSAIEPNELTKTDDETQQALDSVKNAVSQSMNKNEHEINKTSKVNNELANDVSEIINKDLEEFKNILSSLSNLAEEAMYEVFQNKILEISYELAGYQIDKMPEKYEKKIKAFLKNINCYQDKITIEVNDKDFEALSKIKNFNKNEDKNFFISNKELSRGDLILNCDGMRYSEKSNYST